MMLILLILLLLFGGGGFYGYSRFGYGGFSPFAVILLIVLFLFLSGHRL
jgi:hypothetical protein